MTLTHCYCGGRTARTLSLCLALWLSACGAESAPAPGDDATTAASDAANGTSSDAAEIIDDANITVDASTGAHDDAIAPPSGPWAPTLSDGEWGWVSRHDGAGAGAHSYTDVPEDFYEYTRFERTEPFEIRAVKVMVSVAEAQTFRLFIWDDLGGNFLHMEPTTPLASFERAVTTADDMTWLEFTLPEPVRVDPGRMFYVGTIINGELGARIAIDAALTEGAEDKPAWSLIWLSKQIDPASGSNTVFGAGNGDLMVEVEVRDVAIVSSEDKVFENHGPELLGFEGASSYFDLEGDGDLDGATGATLWINDGNNQYSLAPEGTMPEGVSGRGHWADFDNDGDQDVLLSGQVEVLLRNDNGVFVDITSSSGIDDSQTHTCNGVTSDGHVPTETATWIDYDGDGLLDLYLGNFICWDDGFAAKDMLFKNMGDGVFEDVSQPAGLYLGQVYGQASRSTSPADFDNDGDMDLLVNNYRLHRNLHWRNNGDGTLTDVALDNGLAGTEKPSSLYGHSISSAWADFDHDQDLDVFIANLAHPRFLSFSDKARLYLNDGADEPTFTDVTEQVGLRYQETAGAALAWDYDNDGDQDLYWNCIYAGRRSQFYRNEYPTGAWTEVTHPTGLVVENGWETSVADLDDDGDLDMAGNKYWDEPGGNLRINRNPWGRKSIQIRPVGRGEGGTNRDGFGARINVMVDGTWRLVEKTSSSGVSNQSSPWLHVGLGDAEKADVIVEFPLTGSSYSFGLLEHGRYTIDEDGVLTQER
ncbi:MAG: FG-GAP repeat domain-containing protein [Myxococcota bacterium]